MNRVIIPEENVRMITNGSHLVILSLKIRVAVIIDKAMVVMERLIGFRVFIVAMIRAQVAVRIFQWFITFDLQNQCCGFRTFRNFIYHTR